MAINLGAELLAQPAAVDGEPLPQAGGATLQTRRQRVRQTRGWDEAELARRENSQWGLDRKRNFADYVISNTAGVDFARGQVQDVLSRILAKTNRPPSS